MKIGKKIITGLCLIMLAASLYAKGGKGGGGNSSGGGTGSGGGNSISSESSSGTNPGSVNSNVNANPSVFTQPGDKMGSSSSGISEEQMIESEIAVTLAAISRNEHAIKKAEEALAAELAKGDKASEAKCDKYRAEISERTEENTSLRTTLDNAVARHEALISNYGEMEVAGDPVNIVSGDYCAEYEDFSARDNITRFSVSRTFSQGAKSESFGQNWLCPLDTRIIRARPADIPDCIARLDEIIKLEKEIIEKAGSYNSKYGARKRSPEIDAASSKAKTDKENYERFKALILELQEDNKRIDELNRYAAYGAFSSKEKFFGGKSQLYFVDEKGHSFLFYYAGGGEWKACDKLTAKKIKIFGLKADSSISDNESCEGGYKVLFEKGNQSFYSKYGILKRKTDKNGNITEFNLLPKSDGTIQLPTKEILTVKRNAKGFIEEISGPVSGTAKYIYWENYLAQVSDNKEILVGYEYDSQGLLTRIKKADGKFISLSYEYNSLLSKNVCVSVTDEENNQELFIYKPDQREMLHKSFYGGTEIFRYDERGFPVYKKCDNGDEIFLSIDDEEKVVRETGSKENRTYHYDEEGRISKVTYDDGGKESFSYTELGFVEKSYDRDAFYNRWDYDSSGNVIATWFNETKINSSTYYPSGLLKTLDENGKHTDYFYNQYGFLTKKVSKSEGKTCSEIWKYDDKCRVIFHSDKNGRERKISYPDSFSQLETVDGRKQIFRCFDSRGREVEADQKDLTTGIEYKKKSLYDGRGNVIKVYFNDVVFAEYKYTKGDLLESYIIWNHAGIKDIRKKRTARQGIKTAFTHDSAGRILSEKRYAVDGASSARNALSDEVITLYNASYKKQGENTLVTKKNGLSEEAFLYDSKGRLIKETFQDGSFTEYTYTKASRIDSIKKGRFDLKKYSYNRDGTYSVKHQNALNNIESFLYYSDGRIKQYKDYLGLETNYTYDSDFNLILKSGPGKSEKYSYDLKNRLINYELSQSDGTKCLVTSYVYDDAATSVTEKRGNALHKKTYYDVWKRPVKITNGNGTKLYEYDAAGNCIRVLENDVKEYLYEYDAGGNLTDQLIRVKSEGGALFEEVVYSKEAFFNVCGRLIKESKNGLPVFSADYDANGRIKNHRNHFQSLSELEYSDSGRIKSIKTYDGGKTTLLCEEPLSGGIKITAENEGVKNCFEYNNAFQLVGETNPFGKTLFYGYDANGKLTKVKRSSGKEEEFFYDYLNRIITHKNPDYIIERNALGKIQSVTSSACHMEFEYDSGGRMVKFYDHKNHFLVNYYYDEYGRCIQKKGNSFEYNCEYNPQGYISKISTNNPSFAVSFYYDSLGREVERKFSNGTVQSRAYNEHGQKKFVETKDAMGNLIAADYILYDEKGRIEYVCNKNLEVRQYLYDKNGRLTETLYPYTEEIKAFAQKEALDCGLYLKTDNPDGVNLILEAEAVKKLNEILQAAGNSDQLYGKQYSWKEAYDYNPQGCIRSVQNPFGKIIYEYDKMNRLISKHGANSAAEGMSFSWNDDNCLTKIEGRDVRIFLEYEDSLKPVYVRTENLQNGKISESKYKYDYFGRKIYEQNERSQIFTYFYDGLSNECLAKVCVENNFIQQDSDSYAELSSHIRTDTSGLYNNANSTRGMPSESRGSKNEKIRSPLQPAYSSTFLNLCGQPLAVFYENGSLESYAKDFKGNLSASFSEASECKNLIVYDTWGNTLNSAGNMSFSGSDSFLDAGLLFYNISARTYLPELKCFTSQDPAKSGSSWFSFCPCDPVNFSDFSGLEKKSATDEENARYAHAIMFYASLYSLEAYAAYGDSYYIPTSFDCADVSMLMDYYAANYAGISDYSPLAKAFKNAIENNGYKAAADSVWSGNFFLNDEANITKICDGFDSDYLRAEINYYNNNKNYIDYVTRNEVMHNKADMVSYLSNPNFLTPGMVIGMDCRENPEFGAKGHTLTVVARTFDKNGNISGFAYIEGHCKDDTNIGFINLGKDTICLDFTGKTSRIDSWLGKITGLYEIEGKESRKSKADEGCAK